MNVQEAVYNQIREAIFHATDRMETSVYHGTSEDLRNQVWRLTANPVWRTTRFQVRDVVGQSMMWRGSL